MSSGTAEANASNEVKFDITDISVLLLVFAVSVYLFWSQRRRKSLSMTSGAKTVNGVNKVSSDNAIDGNIPKSNAATSIKPPISPISSKRSFLLRLADMESTGAARRLLLFYGSQTGTAEDFCARFAKDAAESYGISALVCDMDDYPMVDLKDLPASVLVGFFLATYGEGEPTDNATDFYDWLFGDNKSPDVEVDAEGYDKGCLKNLRYFVFGLGNKTYEHFNAMAQRVDKRLTLWGLANRIGERGEGDDDGRVLTGPRYWGLLIGIHREGLHHWELPIGIRPGGLSLEEDYSKWKSQMFNSICKFFEIDPENPNPGVTKDGPHVPLFTIARLSADTPDLGKFYLGEFSAVGPRTWENPLLVPTNTALIPHKENKTGQKTIPHDAKHPYYASLHESRSLFAEDIYDDFTYTSTKPLTPTTDYVVQKISQEAGRVRVRRECFHIDLDIQGSGYKYETGDHVGVWPHNDDDQVARLVMALKLGPAELDQVVSLSPNPDNITSMNAKVHFPVPCAIKTAFKYYLDLRQHVKQYHFHILSKYAIDPTEQKELVKVAQLRELYIRLVEQPQVTLAGVLEKFKSISLPIEVVLGELLYAIQVRYYSISSSAKEQPTKVGITAVVVRYLLNEQVKQGLCTAMFSQLHHSLHSVAPSAKVTLPASHIPPYHVPIYIRRSNFKLPRNPRLPVVMVGPGTGVAPFRAFVRERMFLAEQGTHVGPTWLFYGCRQSDKDFLYKDEWDGMLVKVAGWKDEENSSGTVSKVNHPFDLKIVTAFSREPGQDNKVYVQHRLAEHAAKVWELLGKERGYFYVCGDAKHMAHDVHEGLIALAQQHGKMSLDDAEKWIRSLKADGCYQEDVWS